MSDPIQYEKKLTVDTAQTASDKEHLEAQADVVSDPAHADHVGDDWTDEGGATPNGPATTGEIT